MENDKGLIVVLSGFSGAGKGTIMKHLLQSHPNEYHLSIIGLMEHLRVMWRN